MTKQIQNNLSAAAAEANRLQRRLAGDGPPAATLPLVDVLESAFPLLPLVAKKQIMAAAQTPDSLTLLMPRGGILFLPTS